MNYFITGTDTGVGKTHFTSLLVRSLRNAGVNSIAIKPICCGDRDDVHALWEASQCKLSLSSVNPIWLRPAASPYTASMLENRAIDPAEILHSIQQIRQQFPSVLIEGVGGWNVPITRQYSTVDLAREINLPVLVVVHNKLGTINHTLLTVEAIQRTGLKCAGLVINNFGPQELIPLHTNPGIIEELTGVPILFDINESTTSLNVALV